MNMTNTARTIETLCFILLLLTVFVMAVPPCLAQPLQRVEIPSSFNPVGSGARALGMGGAFIAVADDATAASWNPGGLIQLETPELSIVGAYFHRTEDLTLGEAPEADGSQDVSGTNLNYLSAALPFTAFKRNMVLSLNYQYLYDFSKDWQFQLDATEPNLSKSENIDYQQDGGLSAIGLAYAIQVIPQLSFGLTLNYWGDSLTESGWEQKTRQTGSGTFVGNDFTVDSYLRDEYSFTGYNANLGFLWNITSKLTLGGVFKTPYTADLEYTSQWDYTLNFPDNPGANQSGSLADGQDQELDMPMSYGLGIAYRFTDSVSASFDIYRTEWDDFILTDENGNKTSAISGKPESESSVDATHQVRIGAEYLYIGNTVIVPVRGGVFYDPAPAEGSPDNFYGFSLGSGVVYKKIVFDMAYQYRFGNDVGQYVMENLDFSEDVKEHTIYASIIYHF